MPADDSGAGTARHHHRPRRRRTPALRHAVTAATPPAAPSTSTASRGSHVGKPSGANADSAVWTYHAASPDAPLAPTIFSTKSMGKTMSAIAITAIGVATTARATAIAHTAKRRDPCH